MFAEQSQVEIELQNEVRSFSKGKIQYLVSDDSGWSEETTYCLGESGLKGVHLRSASKEKVIEWCRKDTSDRIAQNPEWFNREQS